MQDQVQQGFTALISRNTIPDNNDCIEGFLLRICQSVIYLFWKKNHLINILMYICTTNKCILFICQDLDPYIEKLIPGLKQSLLDPVPEVRTVSAKALGAMVRGIGGAKFDELLKWLMDTLKSEANSVDRSGAAQGIVTTPVLIIQWTK